MEFKTYNIDGDNIYIASPLGLAELNRDYPLFLEGPSKKSCEELLIAKKALDQSFIDNQNSSIIPDSPVVLDGSKSLEASKENLEDFFMKLSNVYRDTIVSLVDSTNSSVTDFYKNKTIYIMTSPDAFQVIRIKD